MNVVRHNFTYIEYNIRTEYMPNIRARYRLIRNIITLYRSNAHTEPRSTLNDVQYIDATMLDNVQTDIETLYIAVLQTKVSLQPK